MQPEIYPQLLKLIEQSLSLTQRQLVETLGVTLGKANNCPRALRERAWVKCSNFSQNSNKFSCAHLLALQGIAQKLCLTAYFLKRMEVEYNHLQTEITALCEELGDQNSAVIL